MRRKRGSPLGNAESRAPFKIGAPSADKARLTAIAEAEGISAGELLREVIAVAAEAVRLKDPPLVDDALSFRVDADTADAWRRAAAAAQLEPAVWLRLLTTSAGRVLTKQLHAAEKRLGRRN